MGQIVLLVKNGMGPKVQSDTTRWDQKSSLAKLDAGLPAATHQKVGKR